MSDGYAAKKVQDLGPQETMAVYAFAGAGMPQHANSVVVWREHDARAISRLLAMAFEAGKEEQRKLQREAMGIYETPWGLRVR